MEGASFQEVQQDDLQSQSQSQSQVGEAVLSKTHLRFKVKGGKKKTGKEQRAYRHENDTIRKENNRQFQDGWWCRVQPEIPCCQILLS